MPPARPRGHARDPRGTTRARDPARTTRALEGWRPDHSQAEKWGRRRDRGQANGGRRLGAQRSRFRRAGPACRDLCACPGHRRAARPTGNTPHRGGQASLAFSRAHRLNRGGHRRPCPSLRGRRRQRDLGALRTALVRGLAGGPGGHPCRGLHPAPGEGVRGRRAAAAGAPRSRRRCRAPAGGPASGGAVGPAGGPGARSRARTPGRGPRRA